MNTTKTNSLTHRIEKIINNKTYVIDIRLNDCCKNGHQDFAITGTIYRGTRKVESATIQSGAIGYAIAKQFPEFKIFNDLHLCDYLGAPMHPSANGFYLLQESQKDPSKLVTAREYVRATDQEFEILKTSEDEGVYKYYLEKLGIVARWKQEADLAIKALEELTGNEFVNDSVRSQYTPLTNKERKEIESKINSGYYSLDQIKARNEARRKEAHTKISEELEADKKAAIWKIEKEYQVKKAAHDFGLSIDSLIYYNHTSEAVFNWNDSSYRDRITKEQFQAFIESGASSLPFGVTWKFGK